MRLAKDLSSLQFGVVLDTALEAVIVMRTDGSIAGWNQAAESPGPHPALEPDRLRRQAHALAASRFTLMT